MRGNQFQRDVHILTKMLITTVREVHKLPNDEAVAAKVGVCPSTVDHWRHGRTHSPRLETLNKFGALVGIHITLHKGRLQATVDGFGVVFRGRGRKAA